MSLNPVSILTIKAYSDYNWHVTQQFEKLGKIITVTAWGYSRRNALENFEQEKIWAAQDDSDLLQEFGNWLMDLVQHIERRHIK